MVRLVLCNSVLIKNEIIRSGQHETQVLFCICMSNSPLIPVGCINREDLTRKLPTNIPLINTGTDL